MTPEELDWIEHHRYTRMPPKSTTHLMVQKLPPASERANSMKGCHFSVSFDFYDERPNANTQDFKDELEEKFQRAVLENRMTNITVKIDHAANLEQAFELIREGGEPKE